MSTTTTTTNSSSIREYEVEVAAGQCIGIDDCLFAVETSFL
jgi:hypothetical protein